MTGEQLLYKFEEHLDHLSDYMGCLHPDLEAWFDLLLALAEKGHLDYRILYNRSKVHPAAEEWMEGNLNTLKGSYSDG
jgi:hypothetical protein